MYDEFAKLSDDEIADLVADLLDAPGRWNKQDVLNRAGYFDDLGLIVWTLVAHGHYPASDATMWPWLADDETFECATAELIVDFLARVSIDEGFSEDDDLQWLTAHWPADLDKISMHAYARDAGLVESRASEFGDRVRDGLDLVRARFGHLDTTEISGEVVESLATFSIEGYTPNKVWDVIDDELHHVPISGVRRLHERRRFFSHVADEERFARASRDALLEAEYMPPLWRSFAAWSVATLEEIEDLLARVRAEKGEYSAAYGVLLAREDATAELADLARRLVESTRMHAEFAAVAAAIRARDAGDETPDVLGLIRFFAAGKFQYGADNRSIELMVEALRTFDEESVKAKIYEAYEDEIRAEKALAVVSVFSDDPEFIERAFDVLESELEDSKFLDIDIAGGFVLLGPEVLPRVVERFEATDHPLIRTAYRKVIIEILAGQETVGPEFEGFVSLSDIEGGEEAYEVGIQQKLSQAYCDVLFSMPEERARARVEQDLSAEKSHWARALAALAIVPEESLALRAFELVAEKGMTSSEVQAWFVPLVSDHLEVIEPYLSKALQNSESPDFHEMVQNTLRREYERLLDGKVPNVASYTGDAHKIRHYAARYFAENSEAAITSIYVLEAGHDEHDDETLNRLGGRPFGVSADDWPQNDDVAMMHMLTIDLDTMPRLRRAAPEEARAVSLFVANPDSNEASVPHNQDTVVRILRNEDTDEFDGALPIEHDPSRGFTVHEIEVPADVFGEARRQNAGLHKVYKAIYQANAWGRAAEPIWLQEADYDQPCLIQFDSPFAPMNLGDNGLMYLFADTAFWQSH